MEALQGHPKTPLKGLLGGQSWLFPAERLRRAAVARCWRYRRMFAYWDQLPASQEFCFFCLVENTEKKGVKFKLEMSLDEIHILKYQSIPILMLFASEGARKVTVNLFSLFTPTVVIRVDIN